MTRNMASARRSPAVRKRCVSSSTRNCKAGVRTLRLSCRMRCGASRKREGFVGDYLEGVHYWHQKVFWFSVVGEEPHAPRSRHGLEGESLLNARGQGEAAGQEEAVCADEVPQHVEVCETKQNSPTFPAAVRSREGCSTSVSLSASAATSFPQREQEPNPDSSAPFHVIGKL